VAGLAHLGLAGGKAGQSKLSIASARDRREQAASSRRSGIMRRNMGQIAEAVTRVVDWIFSVLRLLLVIFGVFAGGVLALILAWAILLALFSPPTANDQVKAAANAQARGDRREAASREKSAQTLFLCQQAAACKKYDTARLECATAGNLKTCLHVKMGDDDLIFTNICSGYDPGAPTRPLPPNTPNVVQCFFERVFASF
jgi:hypothetical protein